VDIVNTFVYIITMFDLRARLCYDAKLRARKKNLHFALTPAHIHIPKFCPVLGIELKQTKGFPGPSSPTLDRIDNTLGYVPWNICVISYKANMLKGNASLEELRALVAYMESHMPNVPEFTKRDLDILEANLPLTSTT